MTEKLPKESEISSQTDGSYKLSKFVIKGCKKLSGRIETSGAKNSVMPIITACCMIKGTVTLHNVPTKHDPVLLLGMMRSLGLKVKKIDKHSWSLDATGMVKSDVAGERTNRIRGSQTLLGALLARNNEVTLESLGGCSIGARPMDMHFKGFEALGASIKTVGNKIHIKAKNGLRGASVFLDFPSVGATENIMIAGCRAEGETTIENCAKEPEIIDLANFLRACGVNISGAGTETIRIIGRKELKPTSHSIMPDRIEVGTYMIAGAMTGGNISIGPINPSHVDSLIFKLQEAGISVRVEGGNRIRIKGKKRPKAMNIRTLPYPGFPTDLQPQMTSMLSVADGVSVITETIFENRFSSVPELVKMGANIESESRTIRVNGVSGLKGTTVKSFDLRGGVSLILAGLIADGETIVEDIEHIERGYEDIESKLRSLGADIKRVD